MRHRVKGRKLSRTASHRLATMRALASSLLTHKKIKTTIAKAKTLRSFVEPIITKAREDSVHARRYVARHIQDNDTVQELFTEILPKIGDRPGGYTRIVKLGQRRGDAAEMAIIELVDYNGLTVSKSKKDAKEVVQGKEVDVDDATVVEDKPKAKKKVAKKDDKKPVKAEKKPAAKKSTKKADEPKKEIKAKSTKKADEPKKKSEKKD